jgi:APA family basic amino acid/polyamine antiporter
MTTVTIMVILLIYKPLYTFPGLGIVLLGIPVFYLWKKYNKNTEEETMQ